MWWGKELGFEEDVTYVYRREHHDAKTGLHATMKVRVHRDEEGPWVARWECVTVFLTLHGTRYDVQPSVAAAHAVSEALASAQMHMHVPRDGWRKPKK
jgi:hypothetical protein